MEDKKETNDGRPMLNPYVFTVLLMGFGLWCFWDGWVAETDMSQAAVTMNRVLSLVLVPWAVWDFFKLRKQSRAGRDKGPSSPSGPGTG